MEVEQDHNGLADDEINHSVPILCKNLRITLHIRIATVPWDIGAFGAKIANRMQFNFYIGFYLLTGLSAVFMGSEAIQPIPETGLPGSNRFTSAVHPPGTHRLARPSNRTNITLIIPV